MLLMVELLCLLFSLLSLLVVLVLEAAASGATDGGLLEDAVDLLGGWQLEKVCGNNMASRHIFVKA